MAVKIFNDRNCFYQYDTKQKFMVDDVGVDELHMTNSTLENTVVVKCYEQGGFKLCDIPNSLLETSGILTVYSFTYVDGKYTKRTYYFQVYERKKPNDYIKEEEVARWGELDYKIDEVEKKLDKKVIELESEINTRATHEDLDHLEETVSKKSNVGHGHEIEDVNNLQKSLDSKANVDHDHYNDYEPRGSSQNTLENAKKYTDEVVKSKANEEHIHDIFNVNGLQKALDSKANSNHDHDISNILNLQRTLDGKANSEHNHEIYHINGLANELEKHTNQFVVTFVDNGGTGQTTANCDKTASEIYEAYASGKTVIGKDVTYGTFLTLIKCSVDQFSFTANEGNKTIKYINFGEVVYKFTYDYQEKKSNDLTTTDKTIVGAINEIKANIGNGGGASVQSDYNQNDETASDYIKNRTHYVKTLIVKETILETTATFEDSMYYGEGISIEANITYDVLWNGTNYKCECKEIETESDGTMQLLGNGMLLGLEDTGEPFLICYNSLANMTMIVTLEGLEQCGIKISGDVVKKVYSPLDVNYLPNSIDLLALEILSPYQYPTARMIELIEFYLSKGMLVRNGDLVVLYFKKQDKRCYYTYADKGEIFNGLINEDGSYRNTIIDFSGNITYKSSNGNETNYIFTINNHREPIVYADDNLTTLWKPNWVRSPNGKMHEIIVDDNGNLSTAHVE